MKKLSEQPYGKAALIVAIVALVVATSGAAVAAIKIQNGSIAGKKLQNGAVTTKKLKNGAVTASKLATIRTASQTLNIPANSNNAVTIPCAANELVIGGGAAYQVVDANANIAIRSSFKDLAANGWRVAVRNNTASAHNYTVEAYCIRR